MERHRDDVRAGVSARSTDLIRIRAAALHADVVGVGACQTRSSTRSRSAGAQRLAPDAGAFGASPWAYNGKVFLLSEDGDTFVVQAGDEFKVLGRNRLSEMTLATPTVARGSLFIRTQSKLYRIGSRR